MADDPINIQVTDNVDPNVERKLIGIADAADKGASALDRLKAELSAIQSSPLSTLQQQATTATNAIKAELAAVNSMNGANATASSSAAKLTVEQRSLSSSIQQTTKDINAQIDALNRLRSAQAGATGGARGGAANDNWGGGGGSGSGSGAAGALDRLEAAANAAAAALNSIRAPQGGSGAGGGSGGGTGGGMSFTRYGGAPDLGELGRGAGLASYQMANLSYQINDVIVSLASGQKPFTVFIQQGAQIFQIYQQAGLGVRGFFAALGEVLRITKTVTAAQEAAALGAARQAEANVAAANASALSNVRAAETNIAVAQAQVAMATTANEATIAQARLAAAQQGLSVANAEAAITGRALSTAQAETATASRAAGLATRTSLTGIGVAGLAAAAVLAGLAIDFTNVKNATSDKEMKTYAASLGLTHNELKKLKDQSVTYGDVAKGLWKTLNDTFDIGNSVSKAWEAIKKFFSDADKAGRESAANIYGFIVGSYRAIVKTWEMWPAALGDLFVQAVNIAVEWIEKLANKSIDAINYVSSQANKILPESLQVPTLDQVSLGRMQNQFAGAAANVGNTFSTEVANAQGEARKGIAKFYSDWEKNSADAAKKRLKNAADEIIASRTPKKDKKEADPKTQADYIDDENKKLDDQIKRFGMLKDAREVQQQLDQIALDFQKRRMPLDDQQLQQFRTKLELIQRNNKVQAEMDRLYDAINGPAQQFAVTQDALNEMLKRGYITLEDYNQRLETARRTLAEATDPLFQMKEALGEAQRATGLYGDAVKDNTNAERVFQAFLAKGIDLRKNATAAQLKEAQAMRDALKQQDRKDYISDEVGSVVNPILEDQKYLDSKREIEAEIQRLRDTGVLSEEQAAKARYEVQSKYDNMRLESTRSVLDQVSALSSSKNKELAAIGKAAAVAQATIDGYQAVQKALASFPPPANYIAAAAVGVAAAANVAKIAGVGFERGGYTGNADRKEIAGVVHGKEYVFDADATARIGVQNLEALRRGLIPYTARGYEGGGYVAPVSAPMMLPAPSVGSKVTVNNYSGEQATVTETRRPDGGMDYEVLVGKLEKHMAGRMQKGGTPLNKAVERRYGVNPARGNG